MKLLILCTLVLSIAAQLVAQEFSFTDQGNQWIYTYYTYCFDDPDCAEDNGDFIQRINGVVVVNDITYSILERYYLVEPANGWIVYKYLREENGVIYEYINDQEELIYLNFTLQVGDVASYPNQIDGGDAIVTHVSTEMIAGMMRKVITFDVPNNSDNAFSEFESYIEGIGFTGNPNQPFSSNADFSTDLKCFSDTSVALGDCTFLSIEDSNIKEVGLYPNPVSATSKFAIDPYDPVDEIQIFNITGQLIKTISVNNKDIYIHRSEFKSSGLYFYRLIRNGFTLISKRFIVR